MDKEINTKQLVLYYMEHPYEYTSRVWTNDIEDEISRAYDDLKENNFHLSKCIKETQATYKKMYCNIRRLQNEEKRCKANRFFINLAMDKEIKELFNSYGLVVREDSIAIGDSKKAAKAFVNMLIPIFEKKMNIKGLKQAKNSSIMSRNLFDFSSVEIND